MQQDNHDQIGSVPILPPIRQPRGFAYYFGTWSGRFIFANLVVFVLMSMYSGSILMPTQETLMRFGAKDPVALAQGEWWRFFTPIFVHIGIIHFAFNSYGLYVIGYQLEKIIGTKWYVATYLLTGIFGNLASSVFTSSMSAGASGALFGLLGCGYTLEKTIGQKNKELTGQKPKQRIYASMVFINILLGILIPGIDNAAHLGGLFSGVAITFAMLRLRPNRLQQQNKTIAMISLATLVLSAVILGTLGTSAKFLESRLTQTADRAKNPNEALYYYSKALEINPENSVNRFHRGRILIALRQYQEAFQDLDKAAENFDRLGDLEELTQELDHAGYHDIAQKLRNIIELHKPDA